MDDKMSLNPSKEQNTRISAASSINHVPIFMAVLSPQRPTAKLAEKADTRIDRGRIKLKNRPLRRRCPKSSAG
jgi:hypothetical protein